MGTNKIATVDGWTFVYRDPGTGLAYAADLRAPFRHTCHPSLLLRGSITRATPEEWWGKGVRVVEFNGYAYNVDHVLASDPLDAIAARFCECVGCTGRKVQESGPDTIRLLQGARDALDLALAGAASILDLAIPRARIEEFMEGKPYFQAPKLNAG